jgi:hypothetical protein
MPHEAGVLGPVAPTGETADVVVIVNDVVFVVAIAPTMAIA